MSEILLPIYFFTKEYPLKTSNKRTLYYEEHVTLLINLFL